MKVTTNAYLYGYNFPLDPTKTVASITENNENNIAIFAVDLVSLPAQVNLGAVVNHTSSNGYQVPANAIGISEDNFVALGNINTTGSSLSDNALASAANWASTQANVWNGQTFTFGPAVANDIVEFPSGILLSPGKYTNLMMLAASVRGVQAGTIIVYYTDGTNDTFYQDISDMNGGYTGAGSTAPGESIAVTMPYFNSASTGKVSTTTYLYGYNFPLNPTKTVSSIAENNNNNIAIFAVDLVSLPAQVNLNAAPLGSSPAFNLAGMSPDTGYGAANLDGSSHSYSAKALGTSVTVYGQVFNLGGVINNDVVKAAGQTITVPGGNFTDLLLLGTATGGVQSNLTFTVNYSDTTHTAFTQSVSDWLTGSNGTGGTTAPGESIAKSMAYYNYWNGSSTSQITTTNYVYQYVFAINPAKVVSSITLPNDANVKILAIDEASLPPQVNLNSAPGGISPAFNLVGLSPDTGYGSVNLDGASHGYSAKLVGNAITWSGQVFNIGAVLTNDVVKATGQTITLSTGYLTNSDAPGQQRPAVVQSNLTFTVNYTDSTHSIFTQSVSDWLTGFNGTGGTTAPGESIAKSMAYYNYWNGSPRLSPD